MPSRAAAERGAELLVLNNEESAQLAIENAHRLVEQGVDVAIEMIGLPQTMQQAVQSLNTMGRAVIVGLSDRTLEIKTYTELLGKGITKASAVTA